MLVAASTGVVLLIIARTAEPAAKYAMLQTTWGPICDLSAELDGTPNNSLYITANVLRKQAAFRIYALRTTIYLQANPADPDGKALTALQAYFDTIAIKIQNDDITAGATQLFRAEKYSSYLKGRIDEFLQIAKDVSSEATHGCFATTGTNKAVTSAATIGDKECKLAASDVAERDVSPRQITKNGYPHLRKPADNAGDGQARGTVECKLLVRHSTDGIGHTAGGHPVWPTPQAT
uniref:Variant surface glycoprotein 1934 n=1 Tax=Trypanosoma brucei TaxID=5691 RepID=M4T1C9_9TRYP|nr:variant surface glycoprotein 1934 [Trypanosoma brucei]